jgi:hypothetical protein
MPDFDLQSCRSRFDEVCEKEFSQRFNLSALEKDFGHLRSEKQWLAAKHVASLFDRKRTPFGRYWQKPDDRELDQNLRNDHLSLALPADDSRNGPLAQRLLEVFHNMGVVSLVLRFAHPDRFGTFSTPVVYLLQIHRETVIELYLAYCTELSLWKERFKMQSVADTETALWTFHKLATGSTKIKPSAELRAQFDADKWIQRRRASQAIRPLIEKYGPLELAWILAELNPKWAGKIAGEEYERLLHCAAKTFYPKRNWDFEEHGWVKNLISEMKRENRILLEDVVTLRKVWAARNRAVHPKDELSSVEVEIMIESIERICKSWEAEPKIK